MEATLRSPKPLEAGAVPAGPAGVVQKAAGALRRRAIRGRYPAIPLNGAVVQWEDIALAARQCGFDSRRFHYGDSTGVQRRFASDSRRVRFPLSPPLANDRREVRSASVARRSSTPLVSAWRGFDSRRRLHAGVLKVRALPSKQTRVSSILIARSDAGATWCGASLPRKHARVRFPSSALLTRSTGCGARCKRALGRIVPDVRLRPCRRLRFSPF